MCLVFIQSTLLFSQKYSVSGVVQNASNEPVAFVNVSVEEIPNFGTTTDIKGNYKLMLFEGDYTLIFSFLGYETVKIPIVIKKSNIKQNIILQSTEIQLNAIKISGKKSDKSIEVIKNVIENKNKYLYNKSFSAEAYIKASEQTTTKVKSEKKDSNFSPSFNISEIYLKVYFSSPNKIKELREGVKIVGDKSGLFFLSHTEGDFNFYKNLIEVPSISETPFLSPISNSAIIAYKFKMIKTFYENEKKYYHIKVSPGLMGNALFNGELIIEDSTWAIKQLRLVAPKYHTPEYDFFEIIQEFETDSTNYYLKRQEFNYNANFGKSKKSGRTIVLYSKYQFDLNLNKKFFNTELSSTSEEAYERDTQFWTQFRKEPLTIEEVKFLRKTDSLFAITNQKSYQDSIDRKTNQITFTKLFVFGQQNYKRSEKRTWSFKPLLFVYTPIYIAGPRVNYWVSYEKEFKNRKNISFSVRPNYGILNEDLKGSMSYSKLYNPFKRSFYNLSLGSDFGIINGFESWIRLFSRSNFYVHDFASVYHKTEIINGLYFGVGSEFSNRRSVKNLKFDSRGDSLWGGNTQIVDFQYYRALYMSFYVGFVPFQKYIREPFQKLILGSNWPEFFARYRKGVPYFSSVVDFDYLEFGVEQDVKIGLLGNSKYRFVSGEFLTSKDLRIVDFKFQRRAGPVFFSNPLYSFQGIDSTYSTIKRFYELHYFHRFNGSLINKIPLLKKLNIIEVAGAGLLYTKERNMQYVEAFVGIEKIIRLWNERFKIGVFFVGAQSNLYSYSPQFKFTIENYDKVSNKWPY